MKRRGVLASVGAAATFGGCLSVTRGLSSLGGTSTPNELEYERRKVFILDDESGSLLATVKVRIANTGEKRHLGLSNTESLDAGEGMLFVHEEEGKQAYVMRDMDFPLDIVFISAEGVITKIHHAPVPPKGTSGDDLKPYRGRGKFILEVSKGYTTRQNVSTGDYIRISSAETESATTSTDKY